VAELDEQGLLAEIGRLAGELRARALASGDHGLAVTARTIADHAAIGSWGLGAIMGDDGFDPETGR
jgi:hypothetical protein